MRILKVITRVCVSSAVSRNEAIIYQHCCSSGRKIADLARGGCWQDAADDAADDAARRGWREGLEVCLGVPTNMSNIDFNRVRAFALEFNQKHVAARISTVVNISTTHAFAWAAALGFTNALRDAGLNVGRNRVLREHIIQECKKIPYDFRSNGAADVAAESGDISIVKHFIANGCSVSEIFIRIPEEPEERSCHCIIPCSLSKVDWHAFFITAFKELDLGVTNFSLTNFATERRVRLCYQWSQQKETLDYDEELHDAAINFNLQLVRDVYTWAKAFRKSFAKKVGRVQTIDFVGIIRDLLEENHDMDDASALNTAKSIALVLELGRECGTIV